MAQVINITNYGPANTLQSSRLSATLNTGEQDAMVQNNEGFAADNFVIIGTPGAETTELKQLASITDKTGMSFTEPANLKHERYDMVTRLFGEKMKVYAAPDTDGLQPADDQFQIIDIIELQPDRAYTQYVHPSGGSEYWYKFTYYNGQTDAETNLSDASCMRGGSTGDYCSIEDVRTEAGFKYAPYVTDAMIDIKRQAAQDEINGTLQGFYTIPFRLPINPFIKDICIRLAAGLLLIEQYGQINTLNTSNGQTKVDKARADLTALATKQKVLVDTNGQSMAQSGSTGGVSGWPNATTNGLQANGVADVASFAPGQDDGHAFKRSDILGYYGRKF